MNAHFHTVTALVLIIYLVLQPYIYHLIIFCYHLIHSEFIHDLNTNRHSALLTDCEFVLQTIIISIYLPMPMQSQFTSLPNSIDHNSISPTFNLLHTEAVQSLRLFLLHLWFAIILPAESQRIIKTHRPPYSSAL